MLPPDRYQSLKDEGARAEAEKLAPDPPAQAPDYQSLKIEHAEATSPNAESQNDAIVEEPTRPAFDPQIEPNQYVPGQGRGPSSPTPDQFAANLEFSEKLFAERVVAPADELPPEELAIVAAMKNNEPDAFKHRTPDETPSLDQARDSDAFDYAALKIEHADAMPAQSADEITNGRGR